MKLTKIMAMTSLTLFSVSPLSVVASPISLTAAGTVIEASGSWVADVGSGFSANIIFDLDENNAVAKERINRDGEPSSTSWTFKDTPYNVGFEGNFGVFHRSELTVETVDNFNADANGNPFGLTGLVDVLVIVGSSMTVDCSGGTNDPVTGRCSDPNAPGEDGQEFILNLVGDSDWLSSDDQLPTSIPDFAGLEGVFGSGVEMTEGTEVGNLLVEYDSLNVSPVPIPAAAWLFGSALIGLAGIKRKN